MKYRSDKYGSPISQLGYGCMRFTRKGGGIDYPKAAREVLTAIDQGVNYFDTAYIYPGSEECLGRILAESGRRDKVNIATKLPQYLMRSEKAIDKTFQEELSRLRTDRVDYYLMHMFTDYMEWENLKKLGIESWIARRKAEGSIRNLGFSFHGSVDTFLKLLEAYDWDFCQIQYNYLDEHSQAGRKGLRAAAEKGIPVIIMEPLRGGRLTLLPDKARAAIKRCGCSDSPAELALRWLWDQPEVTCVLSGMNSMEMVAENLRIASDAEPGKLTDAEREAVEQVRAILREREKVGCTGCRYCMPCPKGVDIPGTFHFYNLMYLEKKGSARREYAQNVGLRRETGFATQCVGCGKCEAHCPQHLPIREKLREADRELRPLPYKIGISAARRFFRR
ncbi:MAG: aldo/keto reductase [Oscillospiraceae bacterium]|nr:aldo/keto reductase [Oscillospiraceae bacterium]